MAGEEHVFLQLGRHTKSDQNSHIIGKHQNKLNHQTSLALALKHVYITYMSKKAKHRQV